MPRSGSGDDDASETVSSPMAHVRPDAAPGAPLAKARVLGALFGESSTAGRFGRFRVLDRLGAGGMGIVYEAYDPDLARGVALKLVNVAAGDSAAALAEAKALAQLSHPNIVPIYDVGLDGGRVFLVMELVRGQTLQRWSADRARSVREVVDIYQQAGRALAAAHAAGLVHRDFKPENAILGADGRVRVIDFGLACEAEDPAIDGQEPRRVAGTPRFMAPEIKAGGAVTPAADQYSFCVALADALGEAGASAGASASAREKEPIPRRIAAMLERGRAEDPTARFASMDELLQALVRDPWRARLRAAVIGGLALAASAVAFYAGQERSREPEVCRGGAVELAAVWNPAMREAALDRVSNAGPYGHAIRDQLKSHLESFAERWAAEYDALCSAQRGGLLDADADRRWACLRRSSYVFRAVGDRVERAERATLPELPRVVQSLPDPAGCADPAVLASNAAPPPRKLRDRIHELEKRLAAARVVLEAGQYQDARKEAGELAESARELNYDPLIAEALVVEGTAHIRLKALEAAVPVLSKATQHAMRAGMDALVIEAWARRAWSQGMQDPADALVGLDDLIEPLAERTPGPIFEQALLFNNVGGVELARRRRAEARERFRHARELSRKVTGRGALELINIGVNLARVEDDRAEADRYMLESIDNVTKRLSETHPQTLEFRELRAKLTIERLRDAADYLAPTCKAYAQHVLPPKSSARCWLELALLRWELGEHADAVAAMQRAASAPDQAPEAEPYTALLRGDPQRAAELFERVLAARQASDATWSDTLEAAELRLGLGRARRATGDLRGAREALQRSLTELDAIVHDSPIAAYERRLGRARVELALTLADLRAPGAEIAPVATAALAWLAKVEGSAEEQASLRVVLVPGSMQDSAK